MDPSLNLDLDDLPIGRALGLHWDAESDTFHFGVVPSRKPPTKCSILSTVSSLYEPLGFLGQFVLPVKFLLQGHWRMAVQWDEQIPEPILAHWLKWLAYLPFVAEMKMPRCFKGNTDSVIRDPAPLSF